MVEAGRQQKAREHHDGCDPELASGTIGEMTIKAAALLVENDP